MTEEQRQQQSQFQVQIIVTPVQGCDGRAEIRVIGGTPRSSTPSLPTHRPVEQSTDMSSGAVDALKKKVKQNFLSPAEAYRCHEKEKLDMLWLLLYHKRYSSVVCPLLYLVALPTVSRSTRLYFPAAGDLATPPRRFSGGSRQRQRRNGAAWQSVVNLGVPWQARVFGVSVRDDMWSAVSRAFRAVICRATAASGANANAAGSPQHRSQRRQASQQPLRSPAHSQGPLSKKDHPLPSAMITAETVSEYLVSHPDFLEYFVMEKVEVEQLERWIIRKSQRLKKKPETKSGRKTSLSRWKFCVHADKRQMLQDLTQSLQQKPTKDQVLWELANCICSAVNADGYKLFLSTKSDPEDLRLIAAPEHAPASARNGSGYGFDGDHALPAYVARTQEPVRLSRGAADAKFPEEVMQELQGEIYHVQCQPIIQSDGQLSAVLELWRREGGGPFYEEDEEIASSYLVWGGIALHYAQLYLNMNQQRKLNDFLLAVVKSIFQDMVSMDMLVTKIMNFAQRLVDADRASLFLVDAKNKELYATIFDIGIESQDSDGTNDIDFEQEEFSARPVKEIRFPLGTGIAGQVALTGEVLNIRDAYGDSRFNRTVDQLTGYKTHTILCMPIYIRGSIIGVVQMVNKRTGYFTKEDEEAFEMFAVYCGLALHHAKLYDKIRKSEQKYKVALEVLSYHNTCTEEEFALALRDGAPQEIIGIDDYYFNPFDVEDYEKARYAIYMFADLFGLVNFDKCSLVKFTLTVRKNYRKVPYHNWTHGFSVANSMYCIIKHSKGVFQPHECLALYIGALCHDLDHRGKNNKFMLDTESPLAAIYSTSTMEHHHFNQTVTILQQEGHNIFNKLSNSDYKQVLGLLKHCILATDLAVFFPNKARLSSLVQTKTFSWTNTEHRKLLQAIAMTGSDLSASAKPWDIQVETVKVIFEEFYEQGDAERATGRTPIPMMDREQPEQQPASQVGFLTGICVPCYQLLYALIPETKPMLDMCQRNLERWRKIDQDIKGRGEDTAP